MLDEVPRHQVQQFALGRNFPGKLGYQPQPMLDEVPRHQEKVQQIAVGRNFPGKLGYQPHPMVDESSADGR